MPGAETHIVDPSWSTGLAALDQYLAALPPGEPPTIYSTMAPVELPDGRRVELGLFLEKWRHRLQFGIQPERCAELRERGIGTEHWTRSSSSALTEAHDSAASEHRTRSREAGRSAALAPTRARRSTTGPALDPEALLLDLSRLRLALGRPAPFVPVTSADILDGYHQGLLPARYNDLFGGRDAPFSDLLEVNDAIRNRVRLAELGPEELFERATYFLEAVRRADPRDPVDASTLDAAAHAHILPTRVRYVGKGAKPFASVAEFDAGRQAWLESRPERTDPSRQGKLLTTMLAAREAGQAHRAAPRSSGRVR